MNISTEATLRQINTDRALASALIFPHRHSNETPDFHIQIMDIWRSADELAVIEAFREGAKTTLSEEFLLLEALFSNFKYLLIFGETYTKACQRIEAMKHELLTNQRIYTLFGKQKGSTWSENKIVLPNGVAIEAHGWEEEIRGFKHLDSRPDRAYLDDIENRERVRDTATVDDNWKRIHIELMPAMDKVNGKIRITGTPLADDCLVRRAANSNKWVKGRFPICDRDIDDPECQATWPSRYPMEWIREKRDYFASVGMLREFNQEYMLIASGAQGKPFEEEHLRFIDVAPRGYSPKVLIMDPARTVEVKTSDQTGRVVVSKQGTKIYVHESGGGYWKPSEIVQNAFDISHKFDDCEVAIEKNSLDEWLLEPMRAMMFKLARVLKFKTLNAPQDRNKSQFIMGLQPHFEAGDIILVGGRANHLQLVSQILNFPSGKRDILNALAYIHRVFSGIPIYEDFSQANIVDRVELSRSATLLLGLNSVGSETAAVLCSLDGQYLTVLADWISPLMPIDALPDIAMLIRAVYPGKKLTAWAPADVIDQVGRNPLVTACKSAGWKLNRGEYAVMTRSTLSPMLRTELRGRRLLQIDHNAKNTLQAFSSGYNWPVKANGERMSEPERGPARSLMEALETLTFAINKPNNDTLAMQTNATNALGTPYLSALPRN